MNDTYSPNAKNVLKATTVRHIYNRNRKSFVPNFSSSGSSPASSPPTSPKTPINRQSNTHVNKDLYDLVEQSATTWNRIEKRVAALERTTSKRLECISEQSHGQLATIQNMQEQIQLQQATINALQQHMHDLHRPKPVDSNSTIYSCVFFAILIVVVLFILMWKVVKTNNAKQEKNLKKLEKRQRRRDLLRSITATNPRLATSLALASNDDDFVTDTLEILSTRRETLAKSEDGYDYSPIKRKSFL